MIFEYVEENSSKRLLETEWFDCLSVHVNSLRISVEIEDQMDTGIWLINTHNTLTKGHVLLNQMTSDKKRLWTFFFNPSSSSNRDTLFFDQYEQVRTKSDFTKILRLQKSTKCRFIVQVVFIWSQGNMKGCIFEAVQVQFVVNPLIKTTFRFSKPFSPETTNSGNSHEKKEKMSVSTTTFVKAKDHRIFGKFLKMVEMGIPIVAVNQKLTLSNVKIPGGFENIFPNDPMPEEWLSSHYDNESDINNIKPSTPLITNVVLRSVKEDEFRERRDVKKDSSFTITLEQIASSIMSLRKTKLFSS